MKTLIKFLSDNRKFITAFIGLYAAYSIGFNQGVAAKPSDQKLAIVQGDRQEVNVGVESATANPSAVDFNQTSEPTPDPSANPNEKDEKNSPSSTPTAASGAAGSESKSEQASPSPSANLVQGITSKMINASGKYSYMGQDVTYNLSFLNTGGAVKGTVGGICGGEVDGNFDGRDGGDISGTVKGSCGVGFLSKKLDAKYSGKVYLNRGIMNITVSGEIPFVEGDQSFSLSFEH